MRISAKCSIALHCLLFVHEYGEEGKVTSDWLAGSTGCNPVVIRGIVSALKKEGILTVRPGTGGTRLACPPEEITVYRVCRALEPDFLEKLVGIHRCPSPLCPIGRCISKVLDGCYEKLRRDLRKSMEDVTLETVVERYRAESGGMKKIPAEFPEKKPESPCN